MKSGNNNYNFINLLHVRIYRFMHSLRLKMYIYIRICCICVYTVYIILPLCCSALLYCFLRIFIFFIFILRHWCFPLKRQTRSRYEAIYRIIYRRNSLIRSFFLSFFLSSFLSFVLSSVMCLIGSTHAHIRRFTRGPRRAREILVFSIRSLC